MTLTEIVDKRRKLIHQIQKLEAMDRTYQDTKFDYNAVVDDTLGIATTLTLPLLTVSLYGLQLLTDKDEEKSRPAKIALGVPCIVIGTALTIPIVTPFAAISAAAEGIRVSQAAISNKRIEKIPERIKQLKREKHAIEEEIKIAIKNKQGR